MILMEESSDRERLSPTTRERTCLSLANSRDCKNKDRGVETFLMQDSTELEHSIRRFSTSFLHQIILRTETCQ